MRCDRWQTRLQDTNDSYSKLDHFFFGEPVSSSSTYSAPHDSGSSSSSIILVYDPSTLVMKTGISPNWETRDEGWKMAAIRQASGCFSMRASSISSDIKWINLCYKEKHIRMRWLLNITVLLLNNLLTCITSLMTCRQAPHGGITRSSRSLQKETFQSKSGLSLDNKSDLCATLLKPLLWNFNSNQANVNLNYKTCSK